MTIHSPANFEPRDYEVEDYLDNHRPEYCPGESRENYDKIVRHWEGDMERALGADWRAKSHRCIHCGNGTVRWITAVKHIPTGDLVVFGAVCTHRLGFADKHAFKLAQLQARAEARKVRFTIYTKRAEFLAMSPAIAEALLHIDESVHARNAFAHDVLNKLDQYGTLSEAQATAVLASMARDVEYAAKRAAQDAEPKGDAPSGRVQVSGTVLSIKEQESDFGITFKMLVKLTNNAKVWVTAPSGVERGDIVTFKATFEVSKDDKSFAFGKRPHLVSRTAVVKEMV